MEFKKGITATFNLSAFTELQNRTLKIMGTKGEIRGVDTLNQIEVRLFGEQDYKTIEPEIVKGGHGGGDTGIMDDFVSLLRGNDGKALTSADISVESHVMAFAAEHSRTTGKSVEIKKFYEEMV